MSNTINIHDVELVTVNPVTDNGDYRWQTIEVTDSNRNRTSITLFIPEGLKALAATRSIAIAEQSND